MARLTKLQLQDRVTNGTDHARDELFNYARTNSLLPGGLNPAQQRVIFEGHVNKMTPQAEAWIGAFLPNYNATHQSWLEQHMPNLPLSNRAKGALGVGAAAVGAGLVGLVTGALVDNEAAKEAINIGSKASIYSSPFLTGVAYASNFVTDTGKNAMKRVGGAVLGSMLALAASQAVDNDTLKGVLRIGSYAGMLGSAGGTLVNLVKYHR